MFRDSKQFTGLADCQARDLTKLDFHFNSSLAALNLAKWDALQHHHSEQDFVFSMASYKRRALNHHLLELFIRQLDLEPTLIKSQIKKTKPIGVVVILRSCLISIQDLVMGIKESTNSIISK